MQCPDLARAEIERLHADGIRPNLDELAELIELARRVEMPVGKTNPVASRQPLRVGDSPLRLYPLTMQAEAWLECRAAMLPSFGAAMVCYASVIGRTPGAFDNLHSWQDVSDAITKWRAGLTCTAEELMDAADRLTGAGEPDTAPADPEARADMEAMLSEVAIESGKPVDYWLCLPSADFVRALSAIAHKRAAAIGAEIKDRNEDAERMRDLLWCVERIRQRAAAEKVKTDGA